MSAKKIKLHLGDEVEVNDSYGAPIALRVCDGQRSTAVSLSLEEARQIARALDAFAEIHS